MEYFLMVLVFGLIIGYIIGDRIGNRKASKFHDNCIRILKDNNEKLNDEIEIFKISKSKCPYWCSKY